MDVILKYKKKDSEAELIEKMVEILTPIQSDAGELDEFSIREKFQAAFKEGKLKKEQIKEILLITEKINGLDPEFIKYTDNLTIEFFKAIAFTENLSDEWLNLFNSDIQSDFWQNQDLVEMETEINSFREKAKL